MIEKDEPLLTVGKTVLTVHDLAVDIGGRRAIIASNYILHVRDACNDWIKHYGAFDINGREVKLDG